MTDPISRLCQLLLAEQLKFIQSISHDGFYSRALTPIALQREINACTTRALEQLNTERHAGRQSIPPASDGTEQKPHE